MISWSQLIPICISTVVAYTDQNKLFEGKYVFGQVLDKFGRKFGQVWTSLFKFEGVWTSLDKFGRVKWEV